MTQDRSIASIKPETYDQTYTKVEARLLTHPNDPDLLKAKEIHNRINELINKLHSIQGTSPSEYHLVDSVYKEIETKNKELFELYKNNSLLYINLSKTTAAPLLITINYLTTDYTDKFERSLNIDKIIYKLEKRKSEYNKDEITNVIFKDVPKKGDREKMIGDINAAKELIHKLKQENRKLIFSQLSSDELAIIKSGHNAMEHLVTNLNNYVVQIKKNPNDPKIIEAKGLLTEMAGCLSKSNERTIPDELKLNDRSDKVIEEMYKNPEYALKILSPIQKEITQKEEENTTKSIYTGFLNEAFMYTQKALETNKLKHKFIANQLEKEKANLSLTEYKKTLASRNDKTGKSQHELVQKIQEIINSHTNPQAKYLALHKLIEENKEAIDAHKNIILKRSKETKLRGIITKLEDAYRTNAEIYINEINQSKINDRNSLIRTIQDAASNLEIRDFFRINNVNPISPEDINFITTNLDLPDKITSESEYFDKINEFDIKLEILINYLQKSGQKDDRIINLLEFEKAKHHDLRERLIQLTTKETITENEKNVLNNWMQNYAFNNTQYDELRTDPPAFKIIHPQSKPVSPKPAPASAPLSAPLTSVVEPAPAPPMPVAASVVEPVAPAVEPIPPRPAATAPELAPATPTTAPTPTPKPVPQPTPVPAIRPPVIPVSTLRTKAPAKSKPATAAAPSQQLPKSSPDTVAKNFAKQKAELEATLKKRQPNESGSLATSAAASMTPVTEPSAPIAKPAPAIQIQPASSVVEPKTPKPTAPVVKPVTPTSAEINSKVEKAKIAAENARKAAAKAREAAAKAREAAEKINSENAKKKAAAIAKNPTLETINQNKEKLTISTPIIKSVPAESRPPAATVVEPVETSSKPRASSTDLDNLYSDTPKPINIKNEAVSTTESVPAPETNKLENKAGIYSKTLSTTLDDDDPIYTGVFTLEEHKNYVSEFKKKPSYASFVLAESPPKLDENNPKYFRKLFARFLEDPNSEYSKCERCTVDERTKKQNPAKASVKMEKLFGEQGTKLYDLALMEEANSKEYRDAVLAKSSKINPGIKNRFIGTILGPSSSGKSKSTKKIKEEVVKKQGQPTSTDATTKPEHQTIITVDGAKSRKVSQVRKWAKRAAKKKKYTGISNLYSKDKPIRKIKNRVFEHAKKHNNSLLIPDTFSKIGVAKFLPKPLADELISRNEYLRYIKQCSESENPPDIFSVRIIGENEADFKNTIEHWGSDRAWDTTEDDSMDYDDPLNAESKAYDSKGRDAGIAGSDIAEKWIKANVPSADIRQSKNDYILVRFDENKKKLVKAKHGEADIISVQSAVYSQIKAQKFNDINQAKITITELQRKQTTVQSKSDATAVPTETLKSHTISTPIPATQAQQRQSTATTIASPTTQTAQHETATRPRPQSPPSAPSRIRSYSDKTKIVNNDFNVEDALKNKWGIFAHGKIHQLTRSKISSDPLSGSQRLNQTVLGGALPITTVVSVQEIKDGQAVSRLYYQPDKIKPLKPEQYMKWAITEVENYLEVAGRQNTSAIVLSGDLPPGLVKAIGQYCQYLGSPKCKSTIENVKISTDLLSDEQKSQIKKIHFNVTRPETPEPKPPAPDNRGPTMSKH